MPVGPLATKFREIVIKTQNQVFTKMHLKVWSVKWRPFCPRGFRGWVKKTLSVIAKLGISVLFTFCPHSFCGLNTLYLGLMSLQWKLTLGFPGKGMLFMTLESAFMDICILGVSTGNRVHHMSCLNGCNFALRIWRWRLFVWSDFPSVLWIRLLYIEAGWKSGQHLADDNLRCIFLNKDYFIFA